MNPIRQDTHFRVKHPTDGFTLIELLTAIAIIAILAGLVLSGISGARERARRSACASNLKQLHLALRMYQDDWNGRRPPWLSNLYPRYVSNLNVYVCPSDDSRGGITSGRDWQFVLFPETKDHDSNNHPLRNAAVSRCSYMWEFTAAPCSWDYGLSGGFIAPSAEDMDGNGDGIVTWQELKVYQLSRGDAANGHQPYSEDDFPKIRCFFHSGRAANNINASDTRAVLNVTVNGRIRSTGYHWEVYAQP